MALMQFSPDVFLNGKRDYVQGTQMLSSAARLVAEHFDPAATLKSAAFHEITDRTIQVSFGEPPVDAANVLGNCQFASDVPECRNAVFLAGEDQAPRRDVPPACTYERLPDDFDHVLSANWRVDRVGGLEDALVAIVQTVKSQHEKIGLGVSDIWFTGLRAARLPLANPVPGGVDRLELRFRRFASRELQHQSLQTIEFVESGLSAAVTFAFKTEQPLDAS